MEQCPIHFTLLYPVPRESLPLAKARLRNLINTGLIIHIGKVGKPLTALTLCPLDHLTPTCPTFPILTGRCLLHTTTRINFFKNRSSLSNIGTYRVARRVALLEAQSSHQMGVRTCTLNNVARKTHPVPGSILLAPRPVLRILHYHHRLMAKEWLRLIGLKVHTHPVDPLLILMVTIPTTCLHTLTMATSLLLNMASTPRHSLPINRDRLLLNRFHLLVRLCLRVLELVPLHQCPLHRLPQPQPSKPRTHPLPSTLRVLPVIREALHCHTTHPPSILP